jgi:outer membrane protein assembly factor BamB
MFTPAVDDVYAYHYNGNSLFLIDRTTGVTSATIADPFGSNSSYDYHGAPMIGGRNNVFTFAGGALSGRASSNAEQYAQRVFSSFNIITKSYEWSTSYAYLTAPAVANGVIYAARNSPMSLDAIDEVTGRILWSWVPTGNVDTSFHRNIVVTRNILFVSTDKTVYALDLATKMPVWSYPKPGMLAISADRTLYIATGALESDGKLVAVTLK